MARIGLILLEHLYLKDRNAQRGHEGAEGFRALGRWNLLVVQPRSGEFQGPIEARLRRGQ